MPGRAARRLGVPLAGVLLTGFFVFLGFPYDRLAARLGNEVGRAMGVQVAIQEVGPRLHLAGPGLEARGVRATWSGGGPLRLDRAAVRPAWSLAWLRGRPALYAQLESPLGAARGVYVADGAGSWDGDLEGLALESLPLERLWPGLAADGRLDAVVEVRMGGSLPEGSVLFEAREGSIKLPDVPVAIPFDTLSGDLVLGEESFVEFRSLDLAGPMVNVGITGRIGRAGAFSQAPLTLDVEVQASDPNMGTLLQSTGLQLAPDGSARLRVGGTASSPEVR